MAVQNWSSDQAGLSEEARIDLANQVVHRQLSIKIKQMHLFEHIERPANVFSFTTRQTDRRVSKCCEANARLYLDTFAYTQSIDRHLNMDFGGGWCSRRRITIPTVYFQSQLPPATPFYYFSIRIQLQIDRFDCPTTAPHSQLMDSYRRYSLYAHMHRSRELERKETTLIELLQQPSK